MNIEKAKKQKATLALADGTIFKGYSIGAEGQTGGEVVFNTSMSGYQEILTDPSYVFQMLTFTCPHIGNVGTNKHDVESDKVHVAGVITRAFCEEPSNFRSEKPLRKYLEENKIVGITDLDTRELVLLLRNKGSQMGIIATGEKNPDDLVDQARKLPSMEGLDLVKQVTCKTAYDWSEGIWDFPEGYKKYSQNELSGRPLVVALDLA